MEDSTDRQQHFDFSLGSCSLVSVISPHPSDLSKLANCLPKDFLPWDLLTGCSCAWNAGDSGGCVFPWPRDTV